MSCERERHEAYRHGGVGGGGERGSPPALEPAINDGATCTLQGRWSIRRPSARRPSARRPPLPWPTEIAGQAPVIL